MSYAVETSPSGPLSEGEGRKFPIPFGEKNKRYFSDSCGILNLFNLCALSLFARDNFLANLAKRNTFRYKSISYFYSLFLTNTGISVYLIYFNHESTKSKKSTKEIFRAFIIFRVFVVQKINHESTKSKKSTKEIFRAFIIFRVFVVQKINHKSTKSKKSTKEIFRAFIIFRVFVVQSFVFSWFNLSCFRGSNF